MEMTILITCVTYIVMHIIASLLKKLGKYLKHQLVKAIASYIMEEEIKK